MSEAPQKVVAVTPAAESLEIGGGSTAGEMKDGLCDCCSHHKSCCAVCCCPSVVFSQLFEKVLGPKGACIAIFTLLQVVGYLAYAASQGAADDDGGGVSTTEMMLSSACTDALIFGLVWYFAHKFYAHYNIKVPSYLCTCMKIQFCLSCMLCQFWRHVHDGDDVNPCCDYSATGDKKDNDSCEDNCNCAAVPATRAKYLFEPVPGGGPSSALLDDSDSDSMDDLESGSAVVSEPAGL